jgi:transposase
MAKRIMMAAHLTQDELKQRIKDSDCLEQIKRYQVVLMRLQHPARAVGEVAGLCGVSYKTVTQWTWLYNAEGPEALLLKGGRGGRRNALMGEEQESSMLEDLRGKAEKGRIITVASVRQAAERLLGRKLPKDYAYDMLHRHQWRKVKPHTHHPKKDAASQEAFKKTSRIFWLPPGRS